MTSVVVGGLFNAVAFAGAGFLFSKLNHSGYEDEMKRHNKALEKLAKAKEKWYESQVEKKEQNSNTQTGISRRQNGYRSHKPCSGFPAKSTGRPNPERRANDTRLLQTIKRKGRIPADHDRNIRTRIWIRNHKIIAKDFVSQS
jgi:hypothetical protein